MPPRPTHMYQGRDWATYRVTVAEAFTILDKMNDLSVCQGWSDDPDIGENALAFIPDLMGLYEELRCQLRLAAADILGDGPSPQMLGAYLAVVEIKSAMSDLGKRIDGLWESDPVQNFSTLVVLIASIKALIKRMDQ